jgi:hypothetical protein
MGKSFVFNAGTAEDEIKKEEIHLTFGVFIDGTIYNMKNTKLQRKYYKEDEYSTII